MRLHLLAVAALTALGLYVASQAGALELANGLTQNGLTQNGLTQNGLTQNGLTQNGLTQNGLASQVTALKAVVLRDGTVVTLH